MEALLFPKLTARPEGKQRKLHDILAVYPHIKVIQQQNGDFIIQPDARMKESALKVALNLPEHDQEWDSLITVEFHVGQFIPERVTLDGKTGVITQSKNIRHTPDDLIQLAIIGYDMFIAERAALSTKVNLSGHVETNLTKADMKRLYSLHGDPDSSTPTKLAKTGYEAALLKMALGFRLYLNSMSKTPLG